LIQLVTYAKEVDPNLKVGFYNILDGITGYENIYNTTGSLTDIHNSDLAFMGMGSGTYNEAEDVFRAVDFLTTADYPSQYESWLDERSTEFSAQDGQTYAASREVDDGGTEVTIPQKPVYFFVSVDYLLPDSLGESPMAQGDLQAILAQRSLDSNGVILWGGEPDTYSYTSWFDGLSAFTSQNPSSVSAPDLSVNTATMTLNWTDDDSAVQGYEIYRSVHHSDPADDDWTKVGYAPAGVTTWSDQQLQADVTDPDLPTGDTYDYKVRAITGIASIFSDSSIVNGDGSGIAPARDGYAVNSAVGWNDESGGTANYTRASEDVEAVDAPATNDGWLEYDNVDLSSGATSLNLDLVYFSGSPAVTIDVYYGAPPGDGGTLAGAFALDGDFTTTATGFANLSYNEFGQVTMSLSIPSSTNSNIYIKFVSSSGTPDQYVFLANWQFAHS
jgi:hypothetical protein